MGGSNRIDYLFFYYKICVVTDLPIKEIEAKSVEFVNAELLQGKERLQLRLWAKKVAYIN
ncbi:MAG: hypothetical protein A2550_04380 [Candidatus Jacksonbacteria bacterium RIFOXYD2_FULL_43_21]|nr:MAG: hypothetical protein A2550_04380 [Candidatus Jacksonbacteria bacterium RIFOXYD2_FULL_43_21]